MGSSRVYFYGADGKELVGHKYNGLELNRSGAFIIRNGVFLANARYEIGVKLGKDLEHTVTAADFGGKPVKVKWWYPGVDEAGHAEWFFLVPPVPGDIEACSFKGTTFPPKAKFNFGDDIGEAA
jgi:hypothetical protein